ncbi:hypothetical protein Tco_1335874 [Tanacetum coccineum]
MNDSILSSSDTTTDSIFEPYLKTQKKNNTEKDDEQSQTKRKCNDANLEANNASNTLNNEQPNKRMCNAERFEVIKHSLGPNEEYIAIRRNIAWDKVENLNPQNTPQVPPSFEEATPPVTHPEEVNETIGTRIEVEPLNKTKLEEVGLNCNHNTPLSSRDVPSFNG